MLNPVLGVQTSASFATMAINTRLADLQAKRADLVRFAERCNSTIDTARIDSEIAKLKSIQPLYQ